MAATACDPDLAVPGPWAICCVPACLDWCGWWLRAVQAALGVLPSHQSCDLFLAEREMEVGLLALGRAGSVCCNVWPRWLR